MKNKLCAVLLLMLCLAMLVCGVACESEDGKDSDTTPPTLEDIIHGGVVIAAEYNYKIGAPPSDFSSAESFVRSDNRYDTADIPTYIVEDMDELRQLYSILPNDYAVYSYDVSGNTDFSTYTYDEAFFETNAILLTRFYCFTGSSAIRYSAQYRREGNTLIIDLEDNAQPDTCYTCDIGWHTMLIPIPRETLDGVTEFKYQYK